MPHRISSLNEWLQPLRSDVPHHKYCHFLLAENPDGLTRVHADLVEYFKAAHEPSRRIIKSLLVPDVLHPCSPSSDPTIGYPSDLHPQTLQEYFGEVLAGIAAEHHEHFGSTQWQVPAYAFHTHTVAFDKLTIARQNGRPVDHVPGRTGDDCLAFERNGNGEIVRIMFCEAKCTLSHDSHLVNANHEKLSTGHSIPGDLIRIIEALKTRDEDPETADWVRALQYLYIKRSSTRCDLASYVCGKKPVARQTWMSQDSPSDKYTGGRHLVSVEIHLLDVKRVIDQVYNALR